MGQDRHARAVARDDRHPDDAPRLVWGALGDIHGAFDAARGIIARHPDVPLWLCVGDIATGDGRYESLGAPVYWIHGNNDNFDAIAAGDLPADLHHIPNGTAIEVGRLGQGDGAQVLTVAGLGGTFAPTWYETRSADLPHPQTGRAKPTERADPSTGSGSSRPRSRDDKRRHFVREEVESCAALRGIDVFLSHEAPKPFRAFPGGRGPDAGKAQINRVLAAMRPRLHLFGHHHRCSDDVREGVRSIGLDLVTRSYALIDAESFAVQVLKLTDR